MDRKGKVFLIGAGPGCPDLITWRGIQALRQADVILCDDLVPPAFLEELGIGGNKEIVRRADRKRVEEISIEEASKGRTVARLKSGDPFVFGRGKEETEALSARGIPWEVIPGPSAFTAAPALAGLPLTWRGEARSFAVTTARCVGGSINRDYPRADSLVVFMAVEVLDDVAAQLARQGWPADAPAVLVERASLPWERRAGGPLSGIARVAKRERITSPALLIVGQAAAPWFPPRARPQILFTGLDPAGFRTVGDLLHWPAVELSTDEAGRKALPGILDDLKTRAFEAAIFTDRTGVRVFFMALAERGLDARLLGGVSVTALGAATGAALQQYGVRPDAVLPMPDAGEASRTAVGRGGRALIVSGTHVPGTLTRGLSEAGLQAATLQLGRVIPHPELGKPLPEHDVIYFVSPSGARAYHAAYGGEAFVREAWCLGEATLEEVKRLGGRGRIVKPDLTGLEGTPSESIEVTGP